MAETILALSDALERRAKCWHDGEHECIRAIDAEVAALREARDAEWNSLERLREMTTRALSAAHYAEHDFDDCRAERVTMALAEAEAFLREMLSERPG